MDQESGASEVGSSAARSAFVLMPFDPEFDAIYSLFMADALAKAGYKARRADDLVGAKNILRDIVEAIQGSDLIVCDLTGSNPNVYYELGLAHAFGKPVILLTQDIEDLPFDLRSYRVIAYSTHFSEIDKAKGRLLETAKEGLLNPAIFGSPVSDFHARAIARSDAQPTEPLPQGVPEAADQLGFLDYVTTVEDGFDTLSKLIADITAETNAIASATSGVADAMQRIPSGYEGSEAKRRKIVIMFYAQKLGGYASALTGKNDAYADTLTRIGNSLEEMIKSADQGGGEDTEGMKNLLATLESVETASTRARAALVELGASMRESPNIEKTFIRARNAAVREVARYEQGVAQTIAIVSRAKELLRARLDSVESGTGGQ